MTDDEYHQALLDKLLEEAREATLASPNELPTEIADLYEIIDTLLEAHNISKEAVLDLQYQRRETRGTFRQHLRLLWYDS